MSLPTTIEAEATRPQSKGDGASSGGPTGPVSGTRRSPALRFAAHYVEMVAVMLAGMLVLGAPLALLATALGAGPAELGRDAPAVVLLAMGFSMTAPMVWWMRRRGHSGAANREMAGAMIVPTLAAVALLGTGAVGDLDALLGIQHVAMFPAMLAVMLLRREEYSHGASGQAHPIYPQDGEDPRFASRRLAVEAERLSQPSEELARARGFARGGQAMQPAADRYREARDADARAAHPQTARADARPVLAAALKRWPTWLAIAMAAVLAPGSSVSGLAEALTIVALGYLAAAALQRRQATWVVAVVAIGALAALRLQDWVEPMVVVLGAALAFVLWGAARGRLRRPGALMLETAGMVGFTAIALAALSVDLDIGRYIVAAGWLGHAVWDAVHLRADKVVARSFAEWCAVFDLLRAVGVLVLPVVP